MDLCRFSAAVLLSAVAMAAVPFDSAADEPQAQAVVLYYAQAECIREYAEHYLEFVDGPTLIFPGFCSDHKFDPSPSEVAAATSQNAFGQSTILFRGTVDGLPVEVPANEKAAVVVMSGDQIRCLREKFTDVVDKVVKEETGDTGQEGANLTLAAFHYDRC